MNPTILVIDDEELIREAVQDALDFSGIMVLAAANGQEGVAHFAAHQTSIKAVLLDMHMPVMDGPTTLQHLRALDPAVKIILCSGIDDVVTTPSFLRDNGLFFLQKPYTFDALLAVVQRTIA
jgi:two-component system, cell cycle sensor histidine kinase and response regulator CckA